MIGNTGCKRRDNSALDRPTSDTIAPLGARRDCAPNRLVGADRRTKNDAIGVADSASQIIGDDVAKPKAFARSKTPTDGRQGRSAARRDGDAQRGRSMSRSAPSR